MISDLKDKYQLAIEDVTKTYGDKVVLDDIDLIVTGGEFCTVVGPSGCGKSTLLRLILGQEQPSSGKIFINGQPVGLPNTDRGIVYQRYSLFPHLTVLKNVMLGQSLRISPWKGWGKKAELQEEAMEYLSRVRLAEHADKYPHELSGGMQQRVAIAQALIAKPQILMMDEPFGALDPETREDMQVFIIELWEKYRMTVFFVTHDLEEALFLGSRNFVLSQYYSDSRGDYPGGRRGAKVVSDHFLPYQANATTAKQSSEFQALMSQIRQDGFNPEYLQHVSEFNLNHPDSFRTLTSETSDRGDLVKTPIMEGRLPE